MAAVHIGVFYILLHAWSQHKHKTVIYRHRGVNLSKVIVHIDLKGSPPKLEYLTSLLPLLKDIGANGLLMEYEDMFPYKGDIGNLSSKYCYKENELKKFIKFAWKSGFEIMPLVQTFGHMEHALKLQEFKHLREIPMYPDSICPSKMESMALIKNMLQQVIQFHTSVVPLRHIHVGCDEVYHMNKCAQCRSRRQKEIDIYMSHLQSVTDIVKLYSPNVTVLFWDDMLRGVDSNYWSTMKSMNDVEPVCWDYATMLHVSHRNLYNYHKKFNNIWIASAYKGAEGVTATLPDLYSRFMNHLEWLRFIFDYKFGGERKSYNFKGIILTGWSRYSHMEPLCELLPASIPSLVMNLLLIKHFQKETSKDVHSIPAAEVFHIYVRDDFKKYFHCEYAELNEFDTHACQYRESKLYSSLEYFIYQNEDIIRKINDNKKGLHSIEYYNKIDHLNMNSIKSNIIWVNESLQDFIATESKVTKAMLEYHNSFVVAEYVHYKFYNEKKKLKSLLKILKDYYKSHTWHRKSYKNFLN
ncbi:Hexosaminidase D [Papilio machaon]|uniref:beta-N-acetylhexosaminidase n=1 Tax=Papilio machaon TaxID=76193 RepID=A0A0N1PI48_PAPMA|nr:Hexosaminidase D [Papilio machaon]